MQHGPSTGMPHAHPEETPAVDPLTRCGKDLVISFLLRSGLIIGFILFGALAFKAMKIEPNMSFLEVSILSGSRMGNYYATITKLSQRASKEKGIILNAPSHGSVENIHRLAKAQSICNVHFALVQDGTTWQTFEGLELIGRVGNPESVLFLGRDADHITQLSDLGPKRRTDHALGVSGPMDLQLTETIHAFPRPTGLSERSGPNDAQDQDLQGARIGIGPKGSGTAMLARHILDTPAFQELKLQLIPTGIQDQLDKLVSGELTLGVFVMDENAKLIHQAIKEKKLQIANFKYVEALAHLLPFLYTGVIVPGQYDPVKIHPPSTRKVLKLDTLLIGNRCISHSHVIAVMTLLRKQFPDFIERNRQSQTRHALPLASSASYFLDNNGGSLADTHVPWLVDFMPTSNWVYAVMVLSIFYNAVSALNNFRLASIDANRVAAERSIQTMFNRRILNDEISRFKIPDADAFPMDRLKELIQFLEDQLIKCRRQSLSVIVPMGTEMGFRDQESLMEEKLAALKILEYRLELGKAPTQQGTRTDTIPPEETTHHETVTTPIQQG